MCSRAVPSAAPRRAASSATLPPAVLVPPSVALAATVASRAWPPVTAVLVSHPGSPSWRPFVSPHAEVQRHAPETVATPEVSPPGPGAPLPSATTHLLQQTRVGRLWPQRFSGLPTAPRGRAGSPRGDLDSSPPPPSLPAPSPQPLSSFAAPASRVLTR